MSLDVYLHAIRETEVFWFNITHNLNKMAAESGLYKYLWRPEEVGIETAVQLIEPLTKGLERLKREKEHLQQFNPPNGWGDYDGLVRCVEQYLDACRENPDAKVRVSR